VTSDGFFNFEALVTAKVKTYRKFTASNQLAFPPSNEISLAAVVFRKTRERNLSSLDSV
jgi:hypothetical protein